MGQNGDGWASAGASARDILAKLGARVGTVLSPYVSDNEACVDVECGEQVANEIRKLLKADGLTVELREDGLEICKMEY